MVCLMLHLAPHVCIGVLPPPLLPPPPLLLPPHNAVNCSPRWQVLKVFIESGEELLQELRQAEEAYTQ